jgi:hypothetical protein
MADRNSDQAYESVRERFQARMSAEMDAMSHVDKKFFSPRVASDFFIAVAVGIFFYFVAMRFSWEAFEKPDFSDNPAMAMVGICGGIVVIICVSCWRIFEARAQHEALASRLDHIILELQYQEDAKKAD